MNPSTPPIIRATDLRAAGLDDRELRHARRRGQLVSVAPGCFVERAAWAALDPRGRYRSRVAARLPRLSPRAIASHDSAAVLWGMPCLETWPTAVHVIDPGRSQPLTRGSLVRHTDPVDDDEVTIGTDLTATSPARTAVDMALRDGFITGLMLFDHGLRTGLFSHDDIDATLSRRQGARRIRAATRALEFATPCAESPWESISRGQMIMLGFRLPELQHQFFEDGLEVARVDFFWDGIGVAGEFDGHEKYTNASLRGGRSLEQVVLDEKWRSEALLDLHGVTRVVRWNAAIARRPTALADRLTRAGVPRLSPRRR